MAGTGTPPTRSAGTPLTRPSKMRSSVLRPQRSAASFASWMRVKPAHDTESVAGVHSAARISLRSMRLRVLAIRPGQKALEDFSQPRFVTYAVPLSILHMTRKPACTAEPAAGIHSLRGWHAALIQSLCDGGKRSADKWRSFEVDFDPPAGVIAALDRNAAVMLPVAVAVAGVPLAQG